MKLTDSLAAPVFDRLKAGFKVRLDELDGQLTRERDKARGEAAKAAEALRSVETELARRLTAERARIAAEEADRAKETVASELAQRERELQDLRDHVRKSDARLAEAHRSQAETLRKERELDAARAELELTVEEKVRASLDAIRFDARRDAEETARLRIAERDGAIATMKRTIEELKQQAEQGSQRRQGQALEIELERDLKARFPADIVEPICNGQPGADIVQQVNGAVGEAVGRVVWELKRTKTWNAAWLGKLRDDQRRCGADAAVIVSQALPDRIEHFDQIDGIWVVSPRCAIPVGVALRQALVEVNRARVVRAGEATKAEQLYRHLTGAAFRRTVEALVEAFDDMRADLDRERKFMTRQFAKRETQIAACIELTVGMVGDLEAIAGTSVAPLLLDGEDPVAPLLDAAEDRAPRK
ncbi:DUF2130 domain-containing protein [Bradyrhizobium genosp. A]|uniref:DUF2130 domain-containing protein n=1 Tax=Bradyrhizobium genosp. A TaxID=83626 RepID=UPI003CFA85F6